MKYLYKITNTVSGKMYIGVTIDPDRRWKQHKGMRTKCSALKDAIEKYGHEVFNFKILCAGSDEYIDELEIKAIEEYKTLVPNGYNLTLGGEGGVIYKWEDEWDKLLGTLSDRDLSKKINIPENTITSRRNAKKIPVFRIINWEDKIPLLGTKPDKVLAKEWGVSASSVWNKRKDYKILPYKENTQYLPQDAINLLGKLSDKIISERFDIPYFLVKKERLRLGIEGVSDHHWVKEYCWSEYELSLIKDISLTTIQLSELLPLSRNTIQKKRKELGIKFDRKYKKTKYEITEELLEDLKNVELSVTSLSLKYDIPWNTVDKYRKKLNKGELNVEQ
ncbi:GIY-YIG nuclease superfamily protein [Vibrio phage 1.187.O._10N.286.49.F1]|nr:GIY-YIG nuclease superfamily protein [Vibrio phage 1.187.O._10N.286.49.F1]